MRWEDGQSLHQRTPLRASCPMSLILSLGSDSFGSERLCSRRHFSLMCWMTLSCFVWMIRLCWRCALDIFLVDGTYELFRHYYALPSARDADGREVAAVRGVLASVLGMIKGGATHVAVATDHVIESFRNGLWPGYKTGAGIEPDLWAQFSL